MKKLASIIMICLISSMAFAQTTVTGFRSQASESGDIFQGNLYSADRVMEMRDKLKLTDAQASKIKKIHADNAGQFTTLKWDLDEETKKLNKMLEANNPSSSAVQSQMDKVLALENELKKKKLTTLVAIKNELNDEQIDMLKNSATTVTGSYIFRNNNQSTAILQGQAKSFTLSSGDSKLLFPDSDNQKVVIRVNTDKEGNQPLYVIDGEVMKAGQKGLKDMNPDDIESISVLKDKSAIEAYGEKGENGVIIITLKKGKDLKKEKK